MTQNPIQLTNSRYRLGYHLMAPAGWINDPNGFCYFKGYYHIFYQYHPYSAEWGPMHWGHARSKDLIHWQTLPTALIPGDSEDKDGCFSGSAIVKDDTLYLIYTGNNYYDDGDPDHYWQNQNLAYSQDGIHFTKYDKNPIIATPPTDNTQNFRDPKVWEHDGHYYVALGSQDQAKLGRLLLYKSDDLKQWQYLGPIAHSQSVEQEGYMWECPDLFHLNGQDILVTSPQGIAAQEQQYLNLHQTGYFVGELDYQAPKFKRGDFHELDQGHDFYAAQTMLTPDGRRVLIGWLNMWESEMPEQVDGWAGALTLPRELIYQNNHLYQMPVAETKSLRQQKLRDEQLMVQSETELVNNQSQVEINLQLDSTKTTAQHFVVQFTDPQTHANVQLEYDFAQQLFTLKRSDRSDARFAQLRSNEKLQIQIFVDTSSLEIFLNQGESTITERYYFDHAPQISLTSDQDLAFNCQIYQLEKQSNNYQINE
ncbi:glycoside hydrolase family 32 protein [Bombilactobacillus bombi]|uniref:glycoside hydrolase family 32 protein n=1 Tax=Bombilactobacillus bombi TaxID=1303590 RepID=UPI000E57E5FA|nr:sucrose-6-phosphate hydrolase [Bombilactobacillus bombi]AXX65464.1 glycoside hydrolase family 32 protein [Bombilactobacillus bombi]